MADTYTCEGCGGTFPKGWTDEEAEAEYEKLYGKPMGEARGILCDHCDRMFKLWLDENKRFFDQ